LKEIKRILNESEYNNRDYKRLEVKIKNRRNEAWDYFPIGIFNYSNERVDEL